ncbi:phage tail tube protein [Rhodococcus qingshengii]|uniref:phage tail tube protein n=1 Tax=Rhodococcus qingshengii TaxID=334542 RepID=UPI0029424B6C|nr:phage tail tube protein [Rhodococcus qingshengii]WOI85996.1 phage tail tube protein [Rhodococcus qingshengii]
MATSEQYIGRRETLGLGIESEAGTGVAAQSWLRWLEQDLKPKTTVVENESAIGVVDRVEDSEVTGRQMEGKIGGKITVDTIGFILLGMWGTVASTTAVEGIVTHTFSLKQSSIPTTLSITSVTPLRTQRFAYATIESFELEAETGKYVTFSSSVKARIGVPANDTTALTTQTEFTSKHITLKLAANTAGIAGATKLKAMSLKLSAERKANDFLPLGEEDNVEFDLGAFEPKGEFVVRCTSDEYEATFLANTRQAIEIAMVNGDESLAFAASKVRFRELEYSKDKDEVVTATISFYCEFDTTTNSSLVPVLKNTVEEYVAA